ncbi:MAG: alpha/beta hydrolase fold domain-containing protein, partial [Pseudomonadales bacterium]
YITKGKGYALSSAQMRWFWDSYLTDSTALEPGQTEHPLATPSSHSDHTNLPPALVLTAENDPLHDEGVAYAEQLRAAACNVQHNDYPGYAHGFIGVLGPKEEHIRGVSDIVAWLKNHT